MLPLLNRGVASIIWRLFCIVCVFSLGGNALALDYLDNKALTKQLKELAKEHKKMARLERAAETLGKNELWRMELGAGNDEARKQRPALLVVAGIEANDLVGTASVLAWAESLLSGYETNTQIKSLLDSTTIYLWPRLNPDGARSFFEKPRVETTTGHQPVDNDHDGLMDEDGPEDLNGDGLISWMRIEDREGEYILDPIEPRLLLKADRLKGERGAWRYLVEGRDNDGDKAWNEDGIGGVNLNRNFPFNYRFFGAGAGPHQVSEPETRALADFVVEHPNIAAAFTFGSPDNLAQTPKGETPKRPPTAIHEEDVGWYREFGKNWRETIGVKKELSSNSEPGTFADWIYFHRGRLSLAARSWSPALQSEIAKNKSRTSEAKSKDDKSDGGETKDGKIKDDSAKKNEGPDKAEQKPAEKGKELDTRNEEERAFLKWIDESAPDSFLRWQPFDHPDFPGQKVELGGFAPFSKSNPPKESLAALAATHSKFLTDLAGKLPRIGIRKTEVTSLGESVYEIKVFVENSGYLPTTLAQGATSREVHPLRVTLKTEAKTILSGARTTMINNLQGGEAKEVRWIVRAKGTEKLEVEVISMLAGQTQETIEMQEKRK